MRKHLNKICQTAKLLTITISSISIAQTDCLSLAQNTYEQAYCEIKSEGKGQNLPHFIEFQKATEKTQYFLIKREAKRLGIHLTMPENIMVNKFFDDTGTCVSTN